ncbi:MAG TPA: VCBS repeat-containing protein, partial [Candidatus Binatia bacterium]|nr:VCBS repeat-containing protein [Candidatus Binatia bacterium]
QLRDFQNADWAERIAQAQVAKKLSQADLFGLLKDFPSLKTPNLAYRNRGDLTFEEVGAAWGFNAPGISQGMCLADLDNDGDMDVVMNNLNEEAGVCRNDSDRPRVAVRLKGLVSNTAGIGARMSVRGGPVERQDQEMICGGRYLSGDDEMRVFAAGSMTNQLTIEVTWRNGSRSVVTNAKPNRIYEIAEAGSAGGLARQSSSDFANGQAARAPTTPLFEDVSELIKHKHVEEPFNDFERQPLLPWRLSQLGPGVAWHDVDGDGREDLIIGSGKGGALAIYRNGQGGFTRMTNAAFSRTVSRDQTAIVGMGGLLLAGSANYEDGLTNGGCLRVYDVARGASGESVLGPLSSSGPLALGDIDGDGDLDLFIGGRAIAGRYPEPATSLLLRNEGGRFVLAERLEKFGLVSGAVFSDLDADGKLELILASDWGPVRVFKIVQEKLSEMTEKLGLAKWKGGWNGVTTGDFDNDGRLDIVASNWGLNSAYGATQTHPRHLYYADLDDNGILETIEARFDVGMGKEVPERGLKAVALALPLLRQTVPTFEAYAAGSVTEIFGAAMKSAPTLEVNTLASMVFFNRGDHFEGVALPREAQIAPAFGVCVGDMDGDGNEDVFLGQNLFATNLEMARNDAGRGIWLKGNGRGEFTAVPGQESGVMVYGEQRGCALADYDADGRVDLVVTQNGNATKLFHNTGPKPGMRVRLKGTTGNPTAVGASMQLIFGQKRGPLREIHAGSGYWSQDGAVQVLGTPEPPTKIVVRWPGGQATTSDVPSGAREIEVDSQGQVRMIR